MRTHGPAISGCTAFQKWRLLTSLVFSSLIRVGFSLYAGTEMSSSTLSDITSVGPAGQLLGILVLKPEENNIFTTFSAFLGDRNSTANTLSICSTQCYAWP